MRTNCHKVLKIPNNFKKLDGISYSVQINDGKQEGNEIRLFPYSLQNLSSLKKFLPEDSTGSGFIYFREVESTMDVSKAIELYAPSGTLILAEIQTQGKGREERPWVGKGGNLYFTLILKLSPYDLAKLNFSASLSVAQTCVDFGVKDVHVKWPNDVWIGYKKVCGVLVNASITGAEAVAQIGIGINVNEDMSQALTSEVRDVAISVSQCLGAEVDREKFLAKVCEHLEYFVSLSWEKIVDIYKTFDFLVGKNIIIMPKKRENPERVSAKAIGFDSDGCLVVERIINGKVVTDVLNTAEVSVRPDMNK